MCGIYCSIPLIKAGRKQAVISPAILDAFLNNRGPNSRKICSVHDIIFGGFVLWQQGNEVCPQPVELSDLILLFNGDLFGADHRQNNGFSDTQWLAGQLEKCRGDSDILAVLQVLNGPYCMIFYYKSSGNMYFARDSLGRNSLIIERRLEDDVPCVRLLSTSYFSGGLSSEMSSVELPPLGLYKLNAATTNNLVVFPWSAETSVQDAYDMADRLNFSLHVMDLSINAEFSVVSVQEPASFSLHELCTDFIREKSSTGVGIFDFLLKNKALNADLNNFSEFLHRSVKCRVLATPEHCEQCIKCRQHCNHSKIAILFSGGIDCTILAILCDKYAGSNDSVDLINVAFENTATTNWDVPDRLSAKSALEELQTICPQRKWNFIEVNVSRQELRTKLEQHIKHLIFPLDTVLDESLGAAFWFASRGQSTVGDEQTIRTTARVMLVGSGADELFGGYQRHRNAYKRCSGSEAEKQGSVAAELQKDWLRIPSRNLARDDRVVADNSKTLRAPFIEENVVQFVQSLTTDQRCCFLLDEGLGDKLFLRLYGYKLGLRFPTSLKKRAIQFGSKIALKKQNATDRSEYLKIA